MDSKKLAAENFDYMVKFRRDLHRHPEPSCEEFRTTDKIAEALDAIGIPYRRLDPTGLIGTIEGGRPGAVVALRADIDALSITEKSGVEFASENPGIMHACGHDVHAAMLLGAAKALYENRAELPGQVRLIFQPAEESLLGAKAVIAQHGLDGVDLIFGLHIFSQMPVGCLAISEGAVTAASDSFKVSVKGAAAHGAMPEKGVDALVAAAATVMNLQSIVSREVSPVEPLVITVGKLNAGTRLNIVAGEAVMEGTVRSFSRELHQRLPGMVERVVKTTAQTYRCTADLEYSMLVEVLMNEAEASRYAREAALKVVAAPELVVPMPRLMGSEDFAEYTAHAKSAFIALGGGGEHPQHSDYFRIEEEAMKTGMAWHIQAALDTLTDKAKGA
jgi:amidohydrolase